MLELNGFDCMELIELFYWIVLIKIFLPGNILYMLFYILALLYYINVVSY